jgi:hypothetical protein
MFRPIRLFAPLVAVALLGLTACADQPAPRAASVAAPAATTQPQAPAKPATPRVTPAPSNAGAADDQSLRLNGDTTGGGSCRAQCERGHNVCMDSVAARTQSGLERPDAGGPFTPSDNCSYQLKQCFQRCNTVR